MYDEQGVGVYLIIDPESKTMQAYRRDDVGKWNEESVMGSVTFNICDDCSATLQLADLF